MFSDLIRKIQSGSIVDPETIASEMLKMVKYPKSSKPAPIIAIAKQMGFAVKSMNELPHNGFGLIVIYSELKKTFGTNKAIIINEKIKYKKLRFIIAHEIGHYLFNFNERINPDYLHVFSEHCNKGVQDDPAEIRINQFAACLLMPKENFIKKYNSLKQDESLPLADIISSLSNTFAVTAKAVEARMSELDVNIKSPLTNLKSYIKKRENEHK